MKKSNPSKKVSRIQASTNDQKPTPNDQRSKVKNPEHPDYELDKRNREKQKEQKEEKEESKD